MSLFLFLQLLEKMPVFLLNDPELPIFNELTLFQVFYLKLS